MFFMGEKLIKRSKVTQFYHRNPIHEKPAIKKGNTWLPSKK